MAATVNPAFGRRMRDTTAFDAGPCMSCGTCTATCPAGIDLLPRRLFRYVLLGLEHRTRNKESEEAIFSCLLCRMCEASCPAGVPIVENVRSLRAYLMKEAYRV